MKKFFTFVMLLAAIAVNAETKVTFDFSDATAYGYANPAQGSNTQLNSGDVLTQDGVTLTISFESGNGFRFFSNTNTGVVNLRAYVNSSFVLAAPEGKKIAAVAIDGSNLNATYLAGDITAKNWSDATGKASLTTNVIKSTVQFNTMTVTLIEEGEIPETPKYDTLNVAAAIAEAEKLANNATSTTPYYVEGYAVNVETYSKDYHNQDFFLVDNAAAPDSKFQAYRATPKKNDAEYPVLAGDKLRLFGSLKKYVKDDKVQLEIVEPTVEFLSEVEGDRTIGGGGETPDPTVTPELPEGVLNCAGVKTLAATASDPTAENKTVEVADVKVRGYVISVYAAKNGTQSAWIADDKSAKAGEVQGYNLTITEEVAKGDYVHMEGKLAKFFKAENNIILEVVNGTMAKVSADGTVTPVDPTPATLDTIDVAKALEIGEKLENGKATDVQYVIKGYSSVIKTAYDPGYKNESFWIVDEKGSKAASNADGAFLVFRGKPDTEKSVGIGALVYVTAKIQKYSDGVIESWSNCAVHVEEQGGEETVESINVTKALEIGNALADKAVSPEKYEITGYVSHIYSFFSKDFNNETVWISDDPENTTTENAFEIYRGRPNTAAEVGWGAKVKIVCQIKNYGGTIENDGTNLPFEVLEASTFVPDTLSIEEAVDIANALGEDAKTPKYHVIKGFIQNAPLPYNYKGSDNKWKNTTIKMSQFPNEQEGPLAVYKANILKADTAKLVQNSYAYVLGYLTKHGGAQVAEGSNVEFVEAPQMDTIHCTVAEAIAAGIALPEGGKSESIYAVTGFVNEIISDFTEGLQSFFMAETAESKDESFYAQDAKIAAAAVVGDKVKLVGRLQNAGDGIIVVENGQARIIGTEGIENVVLTEKVQKVVVDGAIYIIRDNKMFDIRGTQVR